MSAKPRLTLDELGLQTYARYREGESLYVAADGAARRFAGDDLPVGPDTAAAIEHAWAFSALQALLTAASAGSFLHLADADFILDRRVEGGLCPPSTEMHASTSPSGW